MNTAPLLTPTEIYQWLSYVNSEESGDTLHALAQASGVNHQTLKRIVKNPHTDLRFRTVNALTEHFTKLAVREALEWYAAQEAA